MKEVELLRSNMSVCDLHMNRLNIALEGTSHLFPINPETLKNMAGFDLSMLDMLTGRFASLQDTIGHKIFPLIVKIFLEESPSDKSFIDILNKMEKIGALESKVLWNKFRETRNAITHDYPDQLEFMCKQLTLCAHTSAELISYWQFLKNFINNKILSNYK